jgi:Concanavalin A-like lectin/glucanases superfamily
VDQNNKQLIPLTTRCKGWTAEQISADGKQISLQKEGKRHLYGNLDLAKENFSFSVWVNPASVQDGAIITNTTRKPCWGVRLIPSGSGVKVYFSINAGKNTPGLALHSVSDFAIGKWYMLAMSFDRKKGIVRLYVNGEEEADLNIKKHMLPFKKRLTFGGPYWFFDGMIRNLSFYKGMLPESKIKKLYDVEKNISGE